MIIWDNNQNILMLPSQRYYNRKYLMNLKHKAMLKHKERWNNIGVSESMKVSSNVDEGREIQLELDKK